MRTVSFMRCLDEKIAQIISQYRPEEYDSAIAAAEEYAYFRHLSSLRSALLNWYPFSGAWDVLELNAGFGALTGTIAERVRSVDALESTPVRVEAMRTRFRDNDNICIYRQDVWTFAPEKEYDCIVCIDALPLQQESRRTERENLAETLFSRCYALLKPGGRLLVGYRNRFGIHSFCGGVSFEQPRAFSALCEEENRAFSREQMNACVRRVGFIDRAYYYPLPDELFAQVICTDDMPVRSTLSDRMFAYDPFGSPLIAEDQLLYDDLLREGMLHTMANYYLAEFVKPSKALPPARRVTFAALSTDRGREESYTTVLYSDNTVEKTALYPEGVRSLRALRENLQQLSERQISVVPCALEARTLRMTLVEEEPLLDAIGRFAKDDPEKVCQIFDQLRADILRSSDGAEATAQLESAWGISRERMGGVLRKGYIDMIPLNAFWSERGIRYYDQEFCIENCPVNYIMYRAVLYTWMHVARLEESIPMLQMLRRCGLDEAACQAFERRESRFVGANRKTDLYDWIYRWAYRNPPVISEARSALQSKLELQNLLDDVHAVELDLLKKLAEACDQLGLKYFAIHGTLLGAARHQGFIPWDYDVDVAMPRADYEKLLSHREAVFTDPYFLQCFESEKSCFYGGYAKLRNSRTAALELRNRGKRCNQGIWIDIFPLDNCPADAAGRGRLQKRITFLQELLLVKIYPLRSAALFEMNDARLGALHLLARFLRRRWIYAWLHRTLTSVKDGRHLSILACYYGRRKNRNVYPAEELEGAAEMPFEDMVISVPGKWQDTLRRRYGEDYYRLPDESKRYWQSEIIFDTKISWKEKQW